MKRHDTERYCQLGMAERVNAPMALPTVMESALTPREAAPRGSEEATGSAPATEGRLYAALVAGIYAM